LGASADGILPNAVLEIKCPFTGKEETY